MQMIDPEVLSAAKDLSVGAATFLTFGGLMLWSVGWRWHRFWVVFGITLASGIIGLGAGRIAGGQVMVVGVLLAVSAGMLALELARILSFVTGGTAAWMAAQTVLPNAHELWAVFLSGGLIGIVLYRFWTMLLTSLFGTVISLHAGFVLAEQLGLAHSLRWAQENIAAMNGVVIAATLIGVLVQTKTAARDPAEQTNSSEAPNESATLEEQKRNAKRAELMAALKALDEEAGPSMQESVKGSLMGRLMPSRSAA